MRKFLLLGLFLSFLSQLNAQTIGEELDRISELRDNEQFDEAITSLDSLIAIDSVSSRVYYLRGGCFFYKEEFVKAIDDYKTSIQLDSTNENTYYNLANCYENNHQYDSAILNFKKYTELDSTDAIGYVRLANVLRSDGQYEKVLSLYEKAYSIDSTDLYVLYSIAQQNYILEAYDKAISFIDEGIKIDDTDIDFYLLKGLIKYELEDFQSTIEVCEKALEIDSTNFDINTLYIESKILQKTNPKTICKIDYQYKFLEYTNFKLSEILEDISENDYQKYLTMIKEGTTLSLEDYFRFYLSQKYKSGFSPYAGIDNEQIKKLWNEENFDELATLTDDLFTRTPLRLNDIYKVAIANYLINDISTFRRLYTVYFGILEGILATGNGVESESAYIVVTVSDEYALLNYLGLDSSEQSLVNSDGHMYDVLKTVDRRENSQEMFFNVDIPLKSLNSTFDLKLKVTKKDKKKKKKKNKKKKSKKE